MPIGRDDKKPILAPPRLTRKHAALRFGVSVDTVTAWWEEGRLSGVDLNAGTKKKRDLRFSDDDLDSFAEELYRQARADAARRRPNG